MNVWIHNQNDLKRLASRATLTASQQRVLDGILHLARYSNRINVSGPSGVGKTFLGWALHNEGYAEYVSSSNSSIFRRATLIVVDEVHRTDLVYIRTLYSKFLESGKAVVLLTRSKIPDQVPSISLEVTIEDFEKVRDTALHICGNRLRPGSQLGYSNNLWALWEGVSRDVLK